MNTLWSLTPVRSGLIKNGSLTLKNAMGRRSGLSADAQSVISPMTAPARAVTPQNLSYTRITAQKDSSCAKVCSARFSPQESRFSCVRLRCPHCGNTLVPKKDRKHFIVHKCVNPKCPYYLHNLKKVDKDDPKEDYGKNKYRFHYIYREFTVDFLAWT